jgi:hypothetical protein
MLARLQSHVALLLSLIIIHVTFLLYSLYSYTLNPYSSCSARDQVSLPYKTPVE